MKLYYEKSELPEATTLSATTIEEEIRQDRFPKPRQLAAGVDAWFVEDLRAWAEGRPLAQPRAPIARLRTELYRHYDDTGALLYVGVSLNTVARLAQHMQGSAWADKITTIHIERFDTRAEAIEAELRAIRSERPLHNIAGVVAE